MKIKAILLCILVFILGILYIAKERRSDILDTPKVEVSTPTTSTSNATTTPQLASSPKETITPTKDIYNAVFIPQSNSFLDENANFSIDLPEGWVSQKVIDSATTSVTWFYKETNGKEKITGKIVVRRVDINSNVSKLVTFFGVNGLANELLLSMKSELNQYNLATSSMQTIDDREFFHALSTYVANTSKKEVTQNILLTLSETSYYLVVLDLYTDDWIKEGGMYIKSIETFRIL